MDKFVQIGCGIITHTIIVLVIATSPVWIIPYLIHQAKILRKSLTDKTEK